MNIHYKIVEVWPNDHLIVVRYWTDVITEMSMASTDVYKEDGTPVRCRTDVAITLPIPTPAGVDLEKIILRNAPVVSLERQEAILNPAIDTSMDSLAGLLGQVNVTSKEDLEAKIAPPAPVNDPKILTDDEIKALLARL